MAASAPPSPRAPSLSPTARAVIPSHGTVLPLDPPSPFTQAALAVVAALPYHPQGHPPHLPRHLADSSLTPPLISDDPARSLLLSPLQFSPLPRPRPLRSLSPSTPLHPNPPSLATPPSTPPISSNTASCRASPHLLLLPLPLSLGLLRLLLRFRVAWRVDRTQ